MLNNYYVLHSTVTIRSNSRLLDITTKLKTMRTLHSNQLTERSQQSKAYAWNLKRRYRN